MAFPFRQPRVARDARFSALDPSRGIPLYDPDGVMNRINGMLRRRLSDRVEALFQATRVVGDLETAEDLLTVLANVQERDRRKFGGERRSDDPVANARGELAASRTAKRPQSL
jgi:hypothetical protein